MREVPVLVAGLALVACSATTAPSTSTDASPPRPREPKVHRASAVTCADPRPAGTAQVGQGGSCTTDADCTQGTNGRCNSNFAQLQAACSYDACASDKDCGSASVCFCRDPNAFFANVCARGNCVTDADCNGDYCSPSGLGVDSSCRGGLTPGQLGYFCHTAGDACRDDADCAGKPGLFSPICAFSTTTLRWACASAPCAD